MPRPGWNNAILDDILPDVEHPPAVDDPHLPPGPAIPAEPLAFRWQAVHGINAVGDVDVGREMALEQARQHLEMVERNAAAGIVRPVFVKPVRQKEPPMEEKQDLPIRPVTRYSPEFSLEFGLIQDAARRLKSTIISVAGYPYLVRDVEQTKTGQWLLRLRTHDGFFSCVVPDPRYPVRCVEPGYVDIERDGVYYLTRKPARIVKQGLCLDNIVLKRLGSNKHTPWGDILGLLRGLSKRSVIQWNGEAQARLQANGAVLLSPTIGLFAYEDRVLAEYKGRRFGTIEKGCVYSTQKEDMSWIINDFRQVGLELRRP